MSRKIKDATNLELISELEMLTVASVHKTNSGVGTKLLNSKIEKIKAEIIRRMR